MDALTLFCIFAISFIIYKFFNRPKYPPGPPAYPFVGNSSLVKKFSKKHNGLHSAFIELCKIYNTDILSLRLGNEHVVVVQSEELINEVLMNKEFQSRPDNFFARLRCMGKRSGITMTDGPLWAEQRTFAFKHLHELGLGKRSMDDMIQKQLQEMFFTLENLDASSLRLRKLLSKCVLNVLWEMVTGETFKNNEHMLNDLLSFMEERAKAFDVSGGLLSQFPFLRFICPEFSGYSLIQKLNNKFRAMIKKVINKHKETYKPDITRDFIDAFLHQMLKDSPSPTFTEEQLIMVCLDFFIAGSQTTSSTLDFLFLHMIINPEIQERVHRELDAVLKPGDIPSSLDKIRCPYVEAVILESQRTAAVVPLLGPRRTLCDTSLHGYFLPKNTTVLMNISPSYQSPSKWKSPEVMVPERFLDENGKLLTNDKLYTFGKGKRRCPGEALARSFLFIFFSGVMFNYKLQAQDEKNPPELKIIPGITVSPAEYSIKMIKRFNCKDK